MTTVNILAFDDWLRKKGLKQPTIHSYHKFNKTYINDAMKYGYLKENPYIGLKIERGKSASKKYLTEYEVQQIIECEITQKSIDRVRDLFMFQCYTGLSYADLVKFDFKKVIEHDGKYIIHDVRQKTEEDYYIVLLSPAVRILQKYNFKLPIISNAQYNLRLKLVGDYAGLEKSLTSHIARHCNSSYSLKINKLQDCNFRQVTI